MLESYRAKIGLQGHCEISFCTDRYAASPQVLDKIVGELGDYEGVLALGQAGPHVG